MWSFATEFDQIGDGQATLGDSGGAIFAFNGGQWELIGIMYAVSGYGSQPANTSLLGNLTLAAELSVYHDQIVALVPEPGIVALLAPVVFLLLRHRRG